MSPFHASSREKLTHAASMNLYYPTYPNDFPEEVTLTLTPQLHLFPYISHCCMTPTLSLSPSLPLSLQVGYQSLPRGIDGGFPFGSLTLSPPPAPTPCSTDV